VILSSKQTSQSAFPSSLEEVHRIEIGLATLPLLNRAKKSRLSFASKKKEWMEIFYSLDFFYILSSASYILFRSYERNLFKHFFTKIITFENSNFVTSIRRFYVLTWYLKHKTENFLQKLTNYYHFNKIFSFLGKKS